MIEVIWHGRGGQGAFTAARLLGAAASQKPNHFTLAFPSFGPERRGAPMRAFTKLDDKPIGNRSASVQANYVIYLDETLFNAGWEQELKPGGKVLVNSDKSYSDERIISLDANEISSEILGRAIPNTAFLGALAALGDYVSLDEVYEAIRCSMPVRLHESNIAIVNEAFRRVVPGESFNEVTRQETSEVVGQRQRGSDWQAGSIRETGCTQKVGSAQQVSRPPAEICTLRPELPLSPEVFARNTCFEAGYLTQKNAGWRNRRPVVIDDACTGCLQCYLLCPDGTIFKTGHNPKVDSLAAVAVDYDFCKGCGVCAKECPFDAIEMIEESEVTCS